MFEKLRLRIFLSQHGGAAGARVLAKRGALDQLFDHLHGEYGREQEGNSGKLTDFLTWLLDHMSEIMALIAVLFPK